VTTIDEADALLDDVLDALGLGDDDDTTDSGRLAAIRCIRARLDEHADAALSADHDRRADERHYYADARGAL
jgi:hypothetical protein